MTTCSHISGTGPDVFVSAEKPCGEKVLGSGSSANASVFKVPGSEIDYTTDITFTGRTALDFCKHEESEITMKVLVVGSAATSGKDKLLFLLPKGLTLVGDEFKFVRKDSGLDKATYPDEGTLTIESKTTNSDGSISIQTSTLAQVSNLKSYDVIFTVRVGDIPVGCSSSELLKVSYNVPKQFMCGTKQCDNSFVSAGKKNLSFAIKKAEVTLTSVSTTSVIKGNQQTVTANLSITNTSDIDLDANTVVSYTKMLIKTECLMQETT